MANIRKVRITMSGTNLLSHNIQLANPLNPIVRSIKEISGKRKKTDEDLEKMARLEFEGGLYMDDQMGPYIPGANIEKCLEEGARITRQGKAIERGLFVGNDSPIIYKGPRTVDGLWEKGEQFRSVLAVKVGQARVMRCRPLFREWALEADADVDLSVLNLDALGAIAADAGSMVGLGDYRPRYGRFESTVEAL